MAQSCFKFKEGKKDTFFSFLGDVWCLARPYFTSEEGRSAWLLLIAVLALNGAMVALNVALNSWQNQFYDTLQNMDYKSFENLLLTWNKAPEGSWYPVMPGFGILAGAYILIAVYATYLTQWMQIRWRNWMTGKFLDSWLADRAYYRINLATADGELKTDNPDQRIQEDLREFVNATLSLFVDFLSNVATFLSFISILWVVSGAITLFGVTIPAYMVWVALIYSVLGTWLTHLVGRPLAFLRFEQQKAEADFRFALVRLRENAEGVALYSGEADEKKNLLARFGDLTNNWWQIMTRTKKLNALTSGYSQAAVIFPYAVAAPRYFGGAIKLGGLMQIANAFGQVQGALSWFVGAYGSVASLRAVVARLARFQRAIDVARAAHKAGIIIKDDESGDVLVKDLNLELPDGVRLLANEDLTLTRGRSVVINGASGSGKSTLFRAIAGIWPFGSGSVERSVDKCLFLPQRTYIPLGNLRRVVSFPAKEDAYTSEQVKAALAMVGMGHLSDKLDVDDNWPQRLSGGEQQRIAAARALLYRPDWLFLDEATASLDAESEAQLYKTLKRELPNTTIVSIAHRESVSAFHDERLLLKRGSDGQPGTLERTTIDGGTGGH